MVSLAVPPLHGGIGRQALTLARHLVGGGCQVKILTTGPRHLARRERKDGVEIIRLWFYQLGRPRVHLVAFGLRLLAWLWRFRKEYDLVHVHGVNIALAPAVIVAKKLGKPAVLKITRLGDDDPIAVRRRRLAFVRLRAYAEADAVIATSQALTDACQFSGIPIGFLCRIPNGVDTEQFVLVNREEKGKLRSELSLPDGCPVAAYVGSVERRKGILYLLEAWGLVVSRFPTALLVLAGPVGSATNPKDDFDRLIRSRVEELGLASNVRLTGFVSNPEAYLRAADVFLFASLQEGMPNALLEAMACGLPCVVRELPGIVEEIVEHRVSGFIVPDGSPDLFANRVISLLQDPNLRHCFGQRGREAILERFSITNVVQQYEELYSRLFREEHRR